jgi:hypothetical protein
MKGKKMPESKLRELHPKKLVPPPQVIDKMKADQKNKMPKNPVLRFFKIFFGEGF